MTLGARFRQGVRRLRAANGDGDRGMTLLEVVISVTVLGLIMGPLSASLVFFMEHGQDASRQFADDTGSRAAVVTFSGDVQSAEHVVLGDPSPCGSKLPSLVTFQWDSSGVRYRASWSADASGSGQTLVRRLCTGTSVVSSLLVTEIGTVPVVKCTPDCDAATSVAIVGTAANGNNFSITSNRRSN